MPIDPVEQAVKDAWNRVYGDDNWLILSAQFRRDFVSAARASLQAHLEAKADEVEHSGDDNALNRAKDQLQLIALGVRHALDPVEETRP